MKPILIVVESRYGHCLEIARHVADRIVTRGHEIYLEESPGAHPIAVEAFSAVLVIAAIYDRRYPRSIEAFVRSHAYALRSKPNGFVSVSLAHAARPGWARRGGVKIALAFMRRTGWEPQNVLLAGGALAYPSYEPALRRWMQLAAWTLGLPTDTSRRHDLTLWTSIDDTVDDVLAALDSARAA